MAVGESVKVLLARHSTVLAHHLAEDGGTAAAGPGRQIGRGLDPAGALEHSAWTMEDLDVARFQASLS